MPYGSGANFNQMVKACGFPLRRITTATYTVKDDDVVNIFTSATNPVVVTLPKADENGGRILMVLGTVSGLTITPASGDQVNGGGADTPESVNAVTFRSYISDGVNDWIPWNQF